MSAPVLHMEAVSYRYPSGLAPAVQDLHLAVHPGEVVLLTGPTGSGKSTLLRLAAGIAQRHGQGERQGTVRLSNQDPGEMTPSVRVQHVGFVSQVPTDQLVAGTVGDEIAFGPESAGWPAARIEKAIPSAMAAAGLEVRPDRSCTALSGGQTQRLVLAAALAGGAPLLLLDEPISQLDPRGARDLLAAVRRLADRGAAVLMVEHRLSATLPMVDRVVIMAEGRIIHDRPEADPAVLTRLGLENPANPGERPPDDAEKAGVNETTLLTGQGLRYRFPGTEEDALAGIDLSVCAGERVALMGPNGSGKSTLLGALAGHIDAGTVQRMGRIIDVPQNPDLALFCETAEDELAYGPREARLSNTEVTIRVQAAADALGITTLLCRPPQALSRGQRLRTAVAAALTCEPQVLLLDEPTSGQDRAQVDRMMDTLTTRAGNTALVFATHDIRLARHHATRVLVLNQGTVVAEGPPSNAILGLVEA